MKKILYSVCWCFILPVFSSLMAQSPSGIHFQGLALDSVGKIVANKVIALRFSLFNKSGVLEYQEIHKPRTDKFGQFTAVIYSMSNTIKQYK